MTIRDRKSIHTLYFIHRYTPASIARLFGVSHQRIIQLLKTTKNEVVVAEFECQICSNEDALQYFIDGNTTHTSPQNVIMLCEPDKRKFQHLQLRRRRGVLMPQFESDLP